MGRLLKPVSGPHILLEALARTKTGLPCVKRSSGRRPTLVWKCISSPSLQVGGLPSGFWIYQASTIS